MKHPISKFSLFLLLSAAAGLSWAEAMDRPVGIRIGQRMTLKPYLSVSGAYDSNIDGRADGSEDFVWVINPGLGLEYRAETWALLGNVWYQYNGYALGKASSSRIDHHSYGEDLTYRWTDSLPGERGWSLMLSEKFQQINQLENVIDSAGREYGNDRQEVKFAGAIERRITSKLHADVNANYYWLDYNNNNNSGTSYGLYGWDRWGAGAEAGYAFSHWTDLIIAGSYQRYRQQNRDNIYYMGRNQDWNCSQGSHGYTVQAGLGSYATEKLTYRALGGWTTYTYDQGGQSSGGFSYTVSANWIINETWKTMLLATSHYQPTEREYGSSQRIDSISWGLTHSMIQGKLHGNFDLAYRREGREYSAVQRYDYDLDIIAARLGFTYILNRYLQFYTNLEYRRSFCEDDTSTRGNAYDYDRFRGTLGMRFTY